MMNSRFRLTVPHNDISVMEWCKAQHNLSFSLRQLIKDYISEYGVSDPTCTTIVKASKKGRPTEQSELVPVLVDVSAKESKVEESKEVLKQTVSVAKKDKEEIEGSTPKEAVSVKNENPIVPNDEKTILTKKEEFILEEDEGVVPSKELELESNSTASIIFEETSEVDIVTDDVVNEDDEDDFDINALMSSFR